jgi:hypothetical protein
MFDYQGHHTAHPSNPAVFEEESTSIVSSGRVARTTRGSFASVLEMMSTTLAVVPSRYQQHGPAPLRASSSSIIVPVFLIHASSALIWGLESQSTRGHVVGLSRMNFSRKRCDREGTCQYCFDRLWPRSGKVRYIHRSASLFTPSLGLHTLLLGLLLFLLFGEF